jgi:hypothetical protein
MAEKDDSGQEEGRETGHNTRICAVEIIDASGSSESV